MKAESGKGARTVSPARRAAFGILRRVEEEGAYAAVLLAASEDEMRAEDRALCYELVLGTLRWQLWLDALIEHYAGRRAESLDLPVRRALRLGLYQLRMLSRIPASAIVNESVTSPIFHACARLLPLSMRSCVAPRASRITTRRRVSQAQSNGWR